MARAYGRSMVNNSKYPINANADIELDANTNNMVSAEIVSRASPSRMEARSSYRKLRNLPWCKDEREELIHRKYIRILAKMNGAMRTKASKHAIEAASSLLEAKQKAGKQTVTRVAWYSQNN